MSVTLPRRHRSNRVRPNISRSCLKRLARRGGVKRIGGTVYETTRDILRIFVEQVVRCATIFAEYSRRRTITLSDIIYALKRTNGTVLYGFNETSRFHRRTPARHPPPSIALVPSEGAPPEDLVVIPATEPVPTTVAVEPQKDWSAHTAPDEPLPLHADRCPADASAATPGECFHGSS